MQSLYSLSSRTISLPSKQSSWHIETCDIVMKVVFFSLPLIAHIHYLKRNAIQQNWQLGKSH